MVRGVVLVLLSLLVVAMADEADDTAKANYATMQAMVDAYNKNPTDPLAMVAAYNKDHMLKEARVFWINALLDSEAKPLVDETDVLFSDANEAEVKAITGRSMETFTAPAATGPLVMHFAAPIFGSGGKTLLYKWTFGNQLATIGMFTFNDDHKLVAFTDYWLPPTPEASGLRSVGRPYASSVPALVLMADEADDTAKANHASMQAMVAAYNKNPAELAMAPWIDEQLQEAKVFSINALLDSAAKPLVDETDVSLRDATEAEVRATTGGSKEQFSAHSSMSPLVMNFAAPIFGSGGKNILYKWTFGNQMAIFGMLTFNEDNKVVAYTDYYWLPRTPEASALLSVGLPYASSVSTLVLVFGCGLILGTLAVVLGSRVVSGRRVASSAARRKLLDEVQTEHS